MKLTTKDIKMQGRNGQIILRIKDKFGSTEKFAEVVGMSPKSVHQYLSESREYYGKFKKKLEKHLGGSYDSLVQDEAGQVAFYAFMIGREIHLYTEDSDIGVLELVLKLALEYGRMDSIAMSYWNMGMYYLNRGDSDVSLSFFVLGREYAQKAEDDNLETLVVLKMITAYMYLGRYRQADSLIREFERGDKLEKSDAFHKFWYYYSVANLYIHEKDYYCAGEILKKAGGYADNRYRELKRLYLLGICNKNERDYDTALTRYREALAIAESDIEKAVCYNNIAEVYRVTKYQELAEEYVDKAMTFIKPNDIIKHIDIFETYIDVKGSKEGIDELMRILENESESLFLPNVIEAFEKLVSKDVDAKRLEQIIIKYIKYNRGSEDIIKELYRVLGSLRFKEVIRK